MKVTFIKLGSPWYKRKSTFNLQKRLLFQSRGDVQENILREYFQELKGIAKDK